MHSTMIRYRNFSDFLYNVYYHSNQVMYFHSFTESTIDEEEAKKQKSNHRYAHRLRVIYSSHIFSKEKIVPIWWEAVFSIGTAPTQNLLPANQVSANGILDLFNKFNECKTSTMFLDCIKIVNGIVSDCIPVEGRIDFDIIELIKKEKERASQGENTSSGREQHSSESNACNPVDSEEGQEVEEAELQIGSDDTESSPEDDRDDARVSDSRASRLRVFRSRRQGSSVSEKTSSGVQSPQGETQGEGSGSEGVL